STSMIQIPKKKHKALEKKSKPCIFIGYRKGAKGYRVLNPTTHEIYMKRSLKLQEKYPTYTSQPIEVTFPLSDHDSYFYDNLVDYEPPAPPSIDSDSSDEEDYVPSHSSDDL
ncbi:hypothetical protein KI387_025336, partial [Taxus chinensis]